MWPTSITSRCSPVTRSLIHIGGSVGWSPRIALNSASGLQRRKKRLRRLPRSQLPAVPDRRRASRLSRPPSTASARRVHARRRQRTLRFDLRADGVSVMDQVDHLARLHPPLQFGERRSHGIGMCRLRRALLPNRRRGRDRLRTSASKSGECARQSSSVRSSNDRALLDEPPHERADDLVRVAERHSLGDEVVGDVGREQQSRCGTRR